MSRTITDTADAVAALRAKLTPPDPRDGITAIALHHRTRHVATWPTKQKAEATLRQLRARGLNVDKDIRGQRACCTPGIRPWVVTRLGDFGETLLMTEDGSWSAGQLLPERPGDHGAIWLPYESAERGELIPATFTHVTSTAYMAGRTEQYKTKSNGSCGRWVLSQESVARCTCGWKRLTGCRDEARAAARYHRDNPKAA